MESYCTGCKRKEEVGPITKTKILLVEGWDEYYFIEMLLKHCNITDIDIRIAGGSSKFKDKFPTLIKTTGFYNVKAIAILRDAETNMQSTLDSMNNVLSTCGFTPPLVPGTFSAGTPRVGYYLIPNNSDNGMLEDLLLQSKSSSQVMECINAFTQCIDEKLAPEERPLNRPKAKMLMYLSTCRENVYGIGLAAQKHYWDFDSEKLQQLKEFVKQI